MLARYLREGDGLPQGQALYQSLNSQLQPLVIGQGHIVGTASSLYGSITTLLGIGIGTVTGQDYDGTLLPIATGFFFCTLATLAVVLVVEKGRLFKPHRT
jgi:hypothetical protein